MSTERSTPAAAGAVSVADLVARFGGTLLGDGTVPLRRIAPLQRAGADDLAFLSQAAAGAQLRDTAAGCVIVPPACAEQAATLRAAIVTADPYLYYSRAAQWFAARGSGAMRRSATAPSPSSVPPKRATSSAALTVAMAAGVSRSRLTWSMRRAPSGPCR